MNDSARCFIQDFKTSKVYETILQDPSVDIVMIWLTGSTLLDLADHKSDYDLCVLVKQLPKEPLDIVCRVYSRPVSYFINYKKQNKCAQWIYNDLATITSLTSTPLDNIGWAQFGAVTEEAILYINPAYAELVATLITKKDKISLHALDLFAIAAADYLNQQGISSALDLTLIPNSEVKPCKLFAHICWAVDILLNRTPNYSRILEIKRQLVSQLSNKTKEYILQSIVDLRYYVAALDRQHLLQIDLSILLKEET